MKYELFVLILLVGFLCLAARQMTVMFASTLSNKKQVDQVDNKQVGQLNNDQLNQRLESIKSALEAIRENTEGINSTLEVITEITDGLNSISANVSHMRHIGVYSETRWIGPGPEEEIPPSP